MGYGVGQRPASLPAILSATRGGDLSLVASFFISIVQHAYTGTAVCTTIWPRTEQNKKLRDRDPKMTSRIEHCNDGSSLQGPWRGKTRRGYPIE